MIHFRPPLPLPALLALYWSRQVSRRALPAESFEYLESTALGNTALPVATGGADAVAGAAAAGAAVASEPQLALRKSFHFMPLSVPAVLAALYLALHSVIESACADVPCRA